MNNLQINKNQSTLLLDFFEDLKGKLMSTVQILQLRPKLLATVDSHFEGDFDFIIRKRDVYDVLFLIYDSCKKSGVNFTLHQVYKNKRIFKFFISNPETYAITVEFWTAIEYTDRGALKSFKTDSIFDLIASKQLSAPELLTLIYITHLYHKKKNAFSDENTYRFGVFLADLNATENRQGESEIALLLRAIGDRQISLADANRNALNILRRAGLRSSISLVKDTTFFLAGLQKKVFNLNGIVPVVGPDGVGKGSISDQAISQLGNWLPFRYKELYRLRKVYKLRKLLIKDSDHQPDNMLDEQINHYILFASYVTIRLLPRVKKSKRILLDRYFPDYLATPIRYLDNGVTPRKIPFYNVMLRLVPPPNSMVFMGCKTSSLAERKNELPVVSIDFLQHLYCEFILKKRIPVVLFLSTENEIKISSEALARFLNSGN